MKKRNYVSMPICHLVIEKASEKMPYSKIAQMLSLPKSTVGYIIKKCKDGKDVKNLPRSGAPRKRTPREEKLIRRKSVGNPNKDAVQICNEMATEYGLKVSVDTIRRRLDEIGLFARVPAGSHSFEQRIGRYC